MVSEPDMRKENLLLDLNRQLLYEYGSKLVVSSIKEKHLNKFNVRLNYNKIFHIIDEQKKIVYVRNLRFKDIFEAEIKLGEKLKLPLDEINSSINLEYADIRKNVINQVLSNKDLVLKLLKNVHLFSAFLNKFYTIVNELVINDKMDCEHIERLREDNPKFDKYLKLITDMKFGEFNNQKDLISTNELKTVFKDNKGHRKNTVDEILFKIVKENYDYIVYDLSLFTLKTYVTTVSCFLYLYKYHNLKDIKIKIEDFFKAYLMLYKKVTFEKFLERVNLLDYSGILERENDLVSLAV